MRIRVLLILLAAGVAVAAVVLLSRSAPGPALSAEVIALNSGAGAEGFARADHARSFVFPDDQGPHPEYQTEWWYYTGNLETSSGRHFGYQLTFFRRALAPSLATRASDWATNQIYFAHFAVTDVQANEHFASERFSRGAAGLAGASGNPHRVWLEDWEIKQSPLPSASLTATSADALPPLPYALQMRAQDAGHALALTLRSPKPPALHGDGGLSQKSEAVGNASYYVSLTHLETEGTLTVNGQTFAVHGVSWMDQEFGTTGLGPDAVGWDWFSVQLSDQRELMFFQIRQKDGSVEPLSNGTLVNPDGSTRHLTREQVSVEVLAHWTSPASHAGYPARWKITIPSENIALTLRPFIPDQEMRVSFTYWEGAVEISGISRGAPVKGSGYVELTGYAAPLSQ
jgi:predicted secreted hydrolase